MEEKKRVFLEVPDQVVIDNIRQKTTSMIDTIENVYRNPQTDGKLFRDVLIMGKKNGKPVRIGVYGVWAEELDNFLVKPFSPDPSLEKIRELYYENVFSYYISAPKLEEQLVTRN